MQSILIVDDNAINLSVISSTLSDTYKVACAKGGEKALDILKRLATKPDLILLDIKMSGMDGFDVIRILKADDDLKHIPVIFLSASDDEQTKSQADKLGAVAYINKPIDSALLIETVKKYILQD